jgi:uncharacterized membrane protein
MGYRVSAKEPGPTLVVKNHPGSEHLIGPLMGAVFGVVGLGLIVGGLFGDCASSIGEGSPGLFAFVGFVILAVGIAIGRLMYGSTRPRTRFSVDGDTLRIAPEGGEVRELLLEDFVGADVEEEQDAGTTYRTRIRVRGGDPIYLDATATSSRDHYAATAAEINRFVRSA